MPDFVSTVIHVRKRFHTELRKLAEYEPACIIVEGSLRDLLEGRYPGGAHQFYRTVFSWVGLPNHGYSIQLGQDIGRAPFAPVLDARTIFGQAT